MAHLHISITVNETQNPPRLPPAKTRQLKRFWVSRQIRSMQNVLACRRFRHGIGSIHCRLNSGSTCKRWLSNFTQRLKRCLRIGGIKP